MKNATARPDMAEYLEINKLLAVYIIGGKKGVRTILEQIGNLNDVTEKIPVGVINIVSNISIAERDEMVNTCRTEWPDEAQTARQHRRMRRAARKLAPEETERQHRRTRRVARKEAPAPVAAPTPESPSQCIINPVVYMSSKIESVIKEENEYDMKKDSAYLIPNLSQPGMKEQARTMLKLHKKDKATELKSLHRRS